MSKFVEGVKTLFTGGETEALKQERARQDEQVARAREQQSIALTRQQQELQREDSERTHAAGRAGRLPRGRRLLLAATGEQGLNRTLG